MTYFVISATYPARLSGTAVTGALRVLVDNAWGKLAEAWIGDAYAARDVVDIAAMLDAESRIVELRDPDAGIEAKVWNHLPDGTTLTLFVPASRTSATDPRLRQQASALLHALPDGAHVAIFVSGAPVFGPTRGLPPPLDRAPWLAGLTRTYYTRWFTREALLATPATSISEDADGTIWLQLYADPQNPGVLELGRVTAYLAQATLSGSGRP